MQIPFFRAEGLDTQVVVCSLVDNDRRFNMTSEGIYAARRIKDAARAAAEVAELVDEMPGALPPCIQLSDADGKLLALAAKNPTDGYAIRPASRLHDFLLAIQEASEQ